MKESADHASFQGLLLAMPSAGIARFKAIVESQDEAVIRVHRKQLSDALADLETRQ